MLAQRDGENLKHCIYFNYHVTVSRPQYLAQITHLPKSSHYDHIFLPPSNYLGNKIRLHIDHASAIFHDINTLVSDRFKLLSY